jgi:hypothetical protein
MTLVVRRSSLWAPVGPRTLICGNPDKNKRCGLILAEEEWTSYLLTFPHRTVQIFDMEGPVFPDTEFDELIADQTQ